MTDHLVVAGHGPAAYRLVEAVRERDTEDRWRITVVGEEPRPAYDRVALTSYLTDGAELAYPPHDERVRLRTGERVTAVDRAARTVTTAAGHTLRYDALVLATGSVPFVPPVPGAENALVYRTIEDLDALRAAAGSGDLTTSRPQAGVVVGGGLLGLEAARALQGLGLDT